MTTAIQVYNKENESEAAVWLFSDDEKALAHVKGLTKDEFFHNPGELLDFLSNYGVISKSGVLEHSDFKSLGDEDEQIDYLLDNLCESDVCEFYNTLSSEISFVVVHRNLNTN